MKSILDKMVIRDGEFAVLNASVVRVLDLDTREDLMSGSAQHAVGWRFQHRNRPRRELTPDPVAPTIPSH
jgi:hypothetical protein